jgi:hypothetical protein
VKLIEEIEEEAKKVGQQAVSVSAVFYFEPSGR